MSTISILKIESDFGTTLISKKSTQTILQGNKRGIMRNINSGILPNINNNQKLRCLIESKDPPDFSTLKIGNKFKIHSIVEFLECNIETPSQAYVQDSIRIIDKCVKFRPILDMVLINFKCSASNEGDPTWTLDFEGV